MNSRREFVSWSWIEGKFLDIITVYNFVGLNVLGDKFNIYFSKM